MLSEIIWCMSSIGPFPGLERPQWLTPVKPFLKGEPTHSNHKEGEAGILGPHGDHAGHHPSRGMLGLKEAIFDEDNHFKGKDENLMHTQKHVNVLSATKISKKPGVWMSEE